MIHLITWLIIVAVFGMVFGLAVYLTARFSEGIDKEKMDLSDKLTPVEAQALLCVINGAREKCGGGEDNIGCVLYYNDHNLNPVEDEDVMKLVAKLYRVANYRKDIL